MEPFAMTLYVNAPAEQVWDAVVGDEGNRAVMFGSVLRSELTVGAGYEYVGPGNEGEETVHVYGEVLAVEPGRLLSLSEHPGPSYGDNHAELSSRMTWTLEPVTPGVTALTFVNDEWSDGHPNHDGTVENWPRVLSALKTFAETGKTIDYGW
ncbi:SRPBCC domain-containing protein [Compostimonas suwonensis]|uniref:Uncharacterized protein YndB with AHSA1/START domain n=1 Tax=Compostimonas suwonensis TaxID=1048394 RepID=A0A2M9BCH0_9MICO|nr:SRPBCC domain-containing protein [Compostimonas suwonensis]PJJ55640.1 uncharacterized protein YndB with AHSA1/START domain [Compostimonas suwonensis]